MKGARLDVNEPLNPVVRVVWHQPITENGAVNRGRSHDAVEGIAYLADNTRRLEGQIQQTSAAQAQIQMSGHWGSSGLLGMVHCDLVAEGEAGTGEGRSGLVQILAQSPEHPPVEG